jgi:glutaredoxin
MMSDVKKERRKGSANDSPTVIYTAAGCVNSACILQLFQSLHIPFRQIDTTKKEEVINELFTKYGKSYVPLVFHLNQYVGVSQIH